MTVREDPESLIILAEGPDDGCFSARTAKSSATMSIDKVRVARWRNPWQLAAGARESLVIRIGMVTPAGAPRNGGGWFTIVSRSSRLSRLCSVIGSDDVPVHVSATSRRMQRISSGLPAPAQRHQADGYMYIVAMHAQLIIRALQQNSHNETTLAAHCSGMPTAGHVHAPREANILTRPRG